MPRPGRRSHQDRYGESFSPGTILRCGGRGKAAKRSDLGAVILCRRVLIPTPREKAARSDQTVEDARCTFYRAIAPRTRGGWQVHFRDLYRGVVFTGTLPAVPPSFDRPTA